ncbi:MAG: beta-propeller fold lactonase family protein, partial [Candidatus Eremiobacterota bacterium]
TGFAGVIPAIENTTDIEVTPNGNQLYVCTTAGNVWGWNLDGAGNGTVIAGSPFAAGTNPSSLHVDPTSNFIYVTNRGSNNVSVFRIGAGGSLTAVGTVGVAGTSPQDASVSP